jgi:hypothetical protein
MRSILTPRRALVGLGILFLGSVTARTILADRIVAPQLLCDEFVYAGLAKSLAANGHFMLRHEASGLSYVYPALLAPAWWAGSMETVYFLAKAINAIVMTLAAIPFFFWVRRLSSSAWALAATVLLLVLPAFDYTGMLMTENAFLPAFLAAAFAIASSLERPTTFRQLLAVAAIALALGVRAQAAALVVVLPAAIVLYAVLERSGPPTWKRVIHALGVHRVSLLALGGLAALYWLMRLVFGGGTLGPYREVFEADYSVLRGLRWSADHLAELTLATGVVPLVALFVLIGLVATRSFEATRAERAFVATTATTMVAFLLEIGFFTSRFAGTVAERYSFYLGPLLLIALVTWLYRGLPRPALLTAAAAISAAGLVLWLPLQRFTEVSPLYSSFGLYAFHRLPERLDLSFARIELIVSACAVLAVAAFALAPRRLLAAAIPISLAVFFAVSSSTVFGALRGEAYLARYAVGLGADSSWIEEDLGRDQAVTYLYTDTEAGALAATRIVTQAEFWNRNVKWVTSIGATEVCPLPEKAARVGSAGTIEPAADQGALTESIVVTASTLRLAGQQLASHPPLFAYRVRRPLRLSSDIEGIYSDGWTGGHATYTHFEAPAPGSSLYVDVSRSNWKGPDVPGAVEVRVSTLTGRLLARRTWVIHSGTARTFRFRAPRRPFRVDLRIEPTFVPADFGHPDGRSLGALFGVQVVPREPA